MDFGGPDCQRRVMMYKENYGLKAPVEPEHLVNLSGSFDVEPKKRRN